MRDAETQPHPVARLLPILLASVATALVGYQLGRGRDEAKRRDPRARVELTPEVIEGDELRNAGLTYRPVGASGTDYPDWLQQLKGKSGVYVIKEKLRDGSSVVVYVGSSRAGRLYNTITRHLQTWHRSKKFWAGQFTGDRLHDPGVTYKRERVTIAARVLPGDRARHEEGRLIARLKPRDNLTMNPAGDLDQVVPF